MESPAVLQRGMFICSVGFLLVSVLFSINRWPASELFAILGAIVSTGLYVKFQLSVETKKRSNLARHATLGMLVAAIVLRSFDLAAGSYFFLAGFIAFLVWVTWSVLEELPPSED